MRLFWSAVIGSIAGLFMSVRSTTGDAVAFGFCVFIILALILYGIFFDGDNDWLDW